MMKKHTFTGFGFGPIQSGLFVKEAFESGNFDRIVIAEIDQKLVDAVRAAGGHYWVNVATSFSIETVCIEGIEIYNPQVAEDKQKLIEALSCSTEIVTSLPSVKFYDMGADSVASLITEGLKNSTAPGTYIYTAENNNHAAELLEEILGKKLGTVPANVQFLNTVIGKMSQVVTDADEIQSKQLKPITPGIDRAFLVEEFNKILVTQSHIADVKPGIEVFIQKEDLLPFEEAKLYGHNAIHALLAYLGAFKGLKKMADLKDHGALMKIARGAFLDESGAALIRKYRDLDDALFTPDGYRAYAEDLLERMTNPYLDDAIERAARDPQRKLGFDDRLYGTMRLALAQSVSPENMAFGAAAGVALFVGENNGQTAQEVCENMDRDKIEKILEDLWGQQDPNVCKPLINLTLSAMEQLKKL